jgi:hypothetical protein
VEDLELFEIVISQQLDECMHATLALPDAHHGALRELARTLLELLRAESDWQLTDGSQLAPSVVASGYDGHAPTTAPAEPSGDLVGESNRALGEPLSGQVCVLERLIERMDSSQESCHETATKLPRCCHETATKLPRCCHETATKLPRSCHETATKLPRSCHETAAPTAAAISAGAPACAHDGAPLGLAALITTLRPPVECAHDGAPLGLAALITTLRPAVDSLIAHVGARLRAHELSTQHALHARERQLRELERDTQAMLAGLEAQLQAAHAHAAAERSQAQERVRLVEVDKVKLERENGRLLGLLAARERENAKLKAQLDLLLGEDDAQGDAQDDAAAYADSGASKSDRDEAEARACVACPTE